MPSTRVPVPTEVGRARSWASRRAAPSGSVAPRRPSPPPPRSHAIHRSGRRSESAFDVARIWSRSGQPAMVSATRRWRTGRARRPCGPCRARRCRTRARDRRQLCSAVQEESHRRRVGAPTGGDAVTDRAYRRECTGRFATIPSIRRGGSPVTIATTPMDRSGRSAVSPVTMTDTAASKVAELLDPRRALRRSPCASPFGPVGARATATTCSSTPRSPTTTSCASSAKLRLVVDPESADLIKGCDARLPRWPARRRVPHHEPERDHAPAAAALRSAITQRGERRPRSPPPVGPYRPVVRAGDWVVCSGQLGLSDGELVDGGVAASSAKRSRTSVRSCAPRAQISLTW